MMQIPVEKPGANNSITQSMLSSDMQFLVAKSAVENQLRKTCSVTWFVINLGKEEPENICAKRAE